MIILGDFFIKEFNKNIDKDQDQIKNSVYVISFYLITEFLPDLFALDYSFMMSYLRNENTAKLIWTSSPEDRLVSIKTSKVSIDNNEVIS